MKLFVLTAFSAAFLLSSCGLPAPVENNSQEIVKLPDSPFSFMYGEWRGSAKGMTREGPYTLTQTERVGPMLGGDLIVVEGRGYEKNGTVKFNAFGVISYDKREQSYFINVYTNGHAGRFKLDLTDNGFVWTMPAGATGKIINTAVIEGDTWREITKYAPDEGPERITNDMTLTRIGSTSWPSSGVVLPGQIK